MENLSPAQCLFPSSLLNNFTIWKRLLICCSLMYFSSILLNLHSIPGQLSYTGWAKVPYTCIHTTLILIIQLRKDWIYHLFSLSFSVCVCLLVSMQTAYHSDLNTNNEQAQQWKGLVIRNPADCWVFCHSPPQHWLMLMFSEIY